MHCAACGYDLSAHSSGERCPECGLDVDVSTEAAFDDEEAQARRSVHIGIGVGLAFAGCFVWFVTFAMAFNGDSRMPWMIWLGGVAPAAVIGFVGAMFSRLLGWLWPIAFATPMLVWGVFCLLVFPFEGQLGLLYWPAIAAVMVLAGLAGAFAGGFVRTGHASPD